MKKERTMPEMLNSIMDFKGSISFEHDLRMDCKWIS